MATTERIVVTQPTKGLGRYMVFLPESAGAEEVGTVARWGQPITYSAPDTTILPPTRNWPRLPARLPRPTCLPVRPVTTTLAAPVTRPAVPKRLP